jgi:hypothetical protein
MQNNSMHDHKKDWHQYIEKTYEEQSILQDKHINTETPYNAENNVYTHTHTHIKFGSHYTCIHDLTFGCKKLNSCLNQNNEEIIPSILIYQEKILWCFLGDPRHVQESQPSRVRKQHK